jgi:glycosyltransferase involved in cell wall biosynthesis
MTETFVRTGNGSGRGREPTLSVIIPAYNSSAYIAEALESVFMQTFRDFEVIVINDGSPDTEMMERALEPFRERITYLKQENQGPSAARNRGIRAAQGQYLAFLDSDDIWTREYLAAQMTVFEQIPDLDMVYCDTLLFGESTSAGKTIMEENPPIGDPTFDNVLFNEQGILTSCAVVRKKVILQVGMFDEAFIRSEDFDVWLRIAYFSGRIARQEKALARRRVCREGLSQDSHKLLESEIQVLKKFESDVQLPGEKQALLRKALARAEAAFELEQGKIFLLAGDFAGARSSLKKAYAFSPRKKLRLALLGLSAAPQFTRLAAKFWFRFLLGEKPCV